MQNPPPAMRTGFGEDDSTPVKIDKNSPLGKRLISTVFVLVNRAARTSALYCKHSKRTQVTAFDVQQALKYHTMTFFSEEGYESLEKEVASMESLVDTFVTEEATSEEIIDEFCDHAEEDDTASSGEEEEVECECETCHGVRTANWEGWNPTDPAELFLKRHVDEILTT
jgi:hypothetical protein